MSGGERQPEAAVAIVHAQMPEESVLLIRRSERENDPWSGHWSLPGGRREPIDLDALDTAIRELEEECGIRLERSQMETALPPARARRSGSKFLLVAPFVFRVESHYQTVLDPAEAVEAYWIPVATILDPARHALRAVPRRPPEALFPTIELNHVPLWGFTYRLLADWLLPALSGEAGAKAAARVLEFVLAQGAALVREWSEDRVATVQGPMAAEAVLEHFSRPENFDPAINYLEAGPEEIVIAGPGFEVYRIKAIGT